MNNFIKILKQAIELLELRVFQERGVHYSSDEALAAQRKI